MSVTMYNRAKVSYENTLHNLEMAKNDLTIEDAYFDAACFDAQQTVEFLLKAILLEFDVPFEKKSGHDILYLSNLVKNNTNFSFEKQDDLRIIASTITSWEEKGRYSSGIKTKENTVRRVLNICKSIDEEFLLYLKNKETTSQENSGHDPYDDL